MSRQDIIYLSAATDAVDASLVTKAAAVHRFAREHRIEPEHIGVIGDSANDLPFLEISGLGLIGAPGNAHEKVRQRVADLRHGVILDGEVLDGFIEFYAMAMERGIRHIFTDRDGVLLWNEKVVDKVELQQLFKNIAPPARPTIHILTGSSVEQNLKFIADTDLDKAAINNAAVCADPYVIMAENGSLHIHLFRHSVRPPISLNDKLVDQLKGPFQTRVVERLGETVLPEFGLTWTEDPADQVEKCYVAPKRTMVTINIPETFQNGRHYRRSDVAEKLRQAMLDVMVEVAQEQHLVVQQL